MSKAKTKQISVEDPELINMFNKMVGTADPDPDIAGPRFEEIMTNCQDIIKLLTGFLSSPFYRTFREDFEGGFVGIREFVARTEIQLKELQPEKNDGMISGPELSEANKTKFNMTDLIKIVNLTYI